MKPQLRFLSIVMLIFVLTSSCSDEHVPNYKGYYAASFYKEDTLISYELDSDNVGCYSGSAFFGSDPNYIHSLIMQMGHFDDQVSFAPSNTLKIELMNCLPRSGQDENGYNESQFDNFLSARSIEYVDIPNYGDLVKEGVVITYYDSQGAVWTTGDFYNKFNSSDFDYPKFDYDTFQFRISESEKANALIGSSYARKLKMLFNCQMVNSQGEIQQFNFGNVELLYQYPGN